MKHNIGLTYEQLSDIIYYLDWKLMEIREAGCDLEYPDVVDTCLLYTSDAADE